MVSIVEDDVDVEVVDASDLVLVDMTFFTTVFGVVLGVVEAIFLVVVVVVADVAVEVAVDVLTILAGRIESIFCRGLEISVVGVLAIPITEVG